MQLALVTGGGGDIGAAIGTRAAAAGYRVALLDRDGPRALAQAAAVPDLVVNCAGTARFKPLLEQTLEDFESVLRVNLLSAFIVGQAAAQRMVSRGSGSIINITSINGVTPAPNSGAYAASKAGLAKLTELMAVEWGPLGLRVNAVAPGFIDAGLSAPFFANPVVRELRSAAVPSRRLGRSQDIAEAVLFLASEAASYINGHQLVVDGGATKALLALLPREAPAKP